MKLFISYTDAAASGTLEFPEGTTFASNAEGWLYVTYPTTGAVQAFAPHEWISIEKEEDND